MLLLAQLNQKIAANGGLIVSCQPVPDSPLGKPEIVAAIVLAAGQAGAVAIRVEGVANLQATHVVVSVSIIGIVKRNLEDSPVCVTAYAEGVGALAQAGTDIIAIDGTDHPRPVPVETLLTRIHHHDLLVTTDYPTSEDGLACQKLGTEIIGTTPSGYTTPGASEEPDLALMKTLNGTGCRVTAGGHYNTPVQAADAMYHGARAVTIGSATTCLEYICQRYNTAIRKAVL